MNNFFIDSGSQERLHALHLEANEYRLAQHANPEKRSWLRSLQIRWQRFAAMRNKISQARVARASRSGGETV